MKRILAAALCALLVFTLCACGDTGSTEPTYPNGFSGMETLIDAARDEGRLTLLVTGNDSYANAAAAEFEELFGVRVTVRTVTEAQAVRGGGDVWFGGDTANYEALAGDGRLLAYDAVNSAALAHSGCRGSDGAWYAFSGDALGFMVNTDVLRRMGISAPRTWDDLLDPVYRELIWLPDYSTDTGRLFVQMVMDKCGDGAEEYLTALDVNVQFYTANDDTAAKCLASGECVIGVGWLRTAAEARTADNGGDIRLLVPEDGCPGTLYGSAVFADADHPDAAKLWQEFLLSPDGADLAAKCGDYRLPTVSTAALTEQVGLTIDPALLTGYDAPDEETSAAVDELITAVLESLTESGVDVSDPARWNVA